MEDDDVILRPCREDDVPAVTAIYAHAVATGRASFEIDPPDEAEMARRRAALVGGGYPYLVAERAGAVVAYAYAGPYRPRPAYRGTLESSVYVRPDQAGRGLGRRLMARLIAEAEGAGFRQMVAVIGDSHNAASIGLHAALGFRHVGVLTSVGWKHGTWLDTVLMQRALGPGDGTPSRPMSQIGYATAPGPGTPLAEGGAYAQPRDDDGVEAGFAEFRVVVLTAARLEFLYLARQGHRRALFSWDGKEPAATWLAP